MQSARNPPPIHVYLMKYAINYVLGRDTRVLVVDATDRDCAYDEARALLVRRRLFSASLQGSCRVATQSDIDTSNAFVD